MTIEAKIAEILAESNDKGKQLEDGETEVVDSNPDNEENNVDTQNIGGASKKDENEHTKDAVPPEPMRSIKEDIAALTAGEDLTEEFKEKAAVIFEAAVLNRVKEEIARIEEGYEDRLEEEVDLIKQGLSEEIDGYLDYVVETWMRENEIALERGMKHEILENFVHGLKSLFEECYIDIPDEKLDVLGALEEEVEDLHAALQMQEQANEELFEQLSIYQANKVITDLTEGMVDTDKEKFTSLVEELEFDDIETFEKKAQIIKESYFGGKPTVSGTSFVTDTPVQLNENANVSPVMQGYMSILDNSK